MPNNFRLTGYCYVSKEGSDANSGLTPDLPKLTVQAGLNLLTATGRILVIGAGVYKENISFSNSVLNGTVSIVADGYVVLEGEVSTSCILGSSNNANITNITGIEFRNYSFIRYGNLGATTTQSHYWTNCIFTNTTLENGTNTNSGTSIFFTKCQFIGVSFIISSILLSYINLLYINSSIFIGCKSTVNITGTGGIVQFLNNYIDSYSGINVPSTITAANFNFNNIQGKIIMNTGTYSGIALSYADHRTYYPTFNVNSFSSDPLFNNAQNLDFTLQGTSPHIRAASDYISNIGGTEYAKHYEANSTEFTSGATITDLTLLGDNSYTITAPATEGRIITAPLAVQSYPATKPLTGIIWNGSLEFNKSVTAGTQGNQNVPAYDTYTTGAGASPDRLKIKMRYSTQSASPTAGQWDNGGYWAVDTYQLVEVNMKPKVDSNGIGNGDYTYIEFVGLGDLVPTWIQLDIKLRNDYNP